MDISRKISDNIAVYSGTNTYIMSKVTLYDAFTNVSSSEKSRIVKFLNKHSDDDKTQQTDIESALNYAVKDVPSFGGFIINVEDDAGEIIGSTIVTKTGMKGFSSEHLLSFLAVHREHRHNGVFGKMMKKTLEKTSGDLALHVTPSHPNFKNFEEMGFVPRYMEMRLNA